MNWDPIFYPPPCPWGTKWYVRVPHWNAPSKGALMYSRDPTHHGAALAWLLKNRSNLQVGLLLIFQLILQPTWLPKPTPERPKLHPKSNQFLNCFQTEIRSMFDRFWKPSWPQNPSKNCWKIYPKGNSISHRFGDRFVIDFRCKLGLQQIADIARNLKTNSVSRFLLFRQCCVVVLLS